MMGTRHLAATGEGKVDRNEKKRFRERIGEHLDLSGARLTDDEAVFLSDFIDEYDEKHRGRREPRTRSYPGWSSDGKYVRTERVTVTFTDEVGIRTDREYWDDDGQSGHSTHDITDARGILNWFKEQG